MIWPFVVAGVSIFALALIGLGGWLHYRFGDTVRRVEDVLKSK